MIFNDKSIIKIALSERVFNCPHCGFSADRDIKSAECIGTEGLKQIPKELGELTPVGDEASTLIMNDLNKVPHIKASFVVEAGSLRL